MRFSILMVSTLAAGCSYNGTASPGQMNDPSCQITSDQQHAPGWPYKLDTFKTAVLPTLTGTCGAAGCHASPAGQAGFVVWADAQPGNCSYAKTFNSFVKQLDLGHPTNSPAYVAITGGDPAHPLKLDKTDPKVTALLAFVQDAATTQQGSSTGSTPSTSANPFDYTVFQNSIQPILDNTGGTGCTNASCHGGANGIGGLKLVAKPAADSPDMQANFNAVTSFCNLQTPEQSTFYLQATVQHASGTSVVVSANDAQSILAWIKQAKANAGAGAGPSPTCPDPGNFSLAVFGTDIQPILFGTVDLNNRSANHVTSGCARATCHGADRTGGALVIKETNTAAQNLANFACFVNLTNPVASPLLLCPLNQPGCPKSPHPGQDVFLPGATDLNYQRILSYLYAAKTSTTPLDFAYFARAINPIFVDINSVQNGAQNRSCADTVSCHGISAPGQPAPNGSVFGILSNAGDKTALQYNFSIAANFTNFITPRGSSLFLFPTDEIADLANPFATGLHHPGGLDFSPNSAQATSILTWAGGLRPDGTGANANWLVAGTYPAVQITDPTPIDEINATPTIFDSDGALSFNAGQWDGLFSPSATVDFGAEFPQAQNSGRVGYAVAYVINTSPADIQAQITVTSPNAVKLYAGKQPVLQTDNAGGGATALALLPSYTTSRAPTRLLLKVFQRAADPQFNFTVHFQDQFGNVLTNLTGELVFKLSPDGGI
jgi:hypothetical protein